MWGNIQPSSITSLIDPFMTKSLFFKSAFVVALVYSMYLFFNPDLDTGIRIPHFDKVGHFIAFAGLSFLFDFAFALAKIWGIVAALIYGILVELIQSTLPNRQASIADIVADMTGCLVYYFVFKPYAEKLVGKIWKTTDAK